MQRMSPPKLLGPPRWAPGTVVLGALLLSLASQSAAEPHRAQSSHFLTAEICAEHWGLSGWSAIRQGQLRLSHAKDGDQIGVSHLRDRPAPRPAFSVRARTPEYAGNCFNVSDFETGNTNSLGGYFHTFHRAPSFGRTTLERGADGRRALSFDFDLAAEGFSGVSVRLWDARGSHTATTFLDATGFSTMSFWIRGDQGGEEIALHAADVGWNRREDSLRVDDVGAFLPAGKVLPVWQQAVVPLRALPRGIERSELAEIIFLAAAEGGGKGKIHLKTLAFWAEPSPLPELPGPVERVEEEHDIERALWFWNTADVLGRPAEQDQLVRFVHENGFDHLFLQLTSGPPRATGEAGSLDPADPYRPLELDTESLRPLLGKLGTKGIKVHALDGDPRFALPEWHAKVLGTIENVLEYNRRVEPTERFHGIHYDIEPYLLPGVGGVGSAVRERDGRPPASEEKEVQHENGVVEPESSVVICVRGFFAGRRAPVREEKPQQGNRVANVRLAVGVRVSSQELSGFARVGETVIVEVLAERWPLLDRHESNIWAVSNQSREVHGAVPVKVTECEFRIVSQIGE